MAVAQKPEKTHSKELNKNMKILSYEKDMNIGLN